LGEESRTEASGRAIELEAKQEFAWNKISNKKKNTNHTLFPSIAIFVFKNTKVAMLNSIKPYKTLLL